MQDFPDIESAGPLLWHPFAVPAFGVLGLDEAPINSSEIWRRPTIVLFYLGMGCMHCVEQLQAFAPEVKAFTEAGIDIVAVGTDDVSKSRDALIDFEPSSAFRFYCDPELNAFHAFRAFDDFEEIPLHGTFLVDSEGNIRWQDIGSDPFLKTSFLLQETSRRLQIEL